MASSPPQSPRQLRRKTKMSGLSGSDGAVTPDRPSTPATPATTTATTQTAASSATRSSPYLPTVREATLLSVFPALLLFGAVFSAISPQTRAAASAASAAFDTAHFSQVPGAAPSYFARKDNIFNVYFVKRGWLWITVAFAVFVGVHPAFASSVSSSSSRHAVLGRRAAAIVRWALVTAWWFVVTQWCFGPPLIDRSFRLTGGACAGETDGLAALATAAACKRRGGRWRGGHDISGHVFLLVLGTTFLAQEVGWVLWRSSTRNSSSSAGRRAGENRAIVMADGAVKTAEVEAEAAPAPAPAAGALDNPVALVASRFVAAVVALSLWMLLMTAVYFHTWFEKLTGLLVALTGLYGVYVVPRFVPAVRRWVGLPGL